MQAGQILNLKKGNEGKVFEMYAASNSAYRSTGATKSFSAQERAMAAS